MWLSFLLRKKTYVLFTALVFVYISLLHFNIPINMIKFQSASHRLKNMTALAWYANIVLIPPPPSPPPNCVVREVFAQPFTDDVKLHAAPAGFFPFLGRSQMLSITRSTHSNGSVGVFKFSGTICFQTLTYVPNCNGLDNHWPVCFWSDDMFLTGGGMHYKSCSKKPSESI